MPTRAQLKQDAKSKLAGLWGKGALLILVYIGLEIALALAGYIPFVGGIAAFIISPIFAMGVYRAMLSISRREPFEVGTIFSRFSDWGNSFGVLFFMGLFMILWSMLFLIPGIIASYRYRMAPYIILDNPGITPLEAINRSKEMMKGRKGELFVLDLSFIGWGFLSMLTLWIGGLWLLPYIYTTEANFYNALAYSNNQYGSFTPVNPYNVPPQVTN